MHICYSSTLRSTPLYLKNANPTRITASASSTDCVTFDLSAQIAGVSVDLLARILEKPENVHLNLEPSDYIRDPRLTSTYKGGHTERKLIKPNYDDAGGWVCAVCRACVQHVCSCDGAHSWGWQSAFCAASVEVDGSRIALSLKLTWQATKSGKGCTYF